MGFETSTVRDIITRRAIEAVQQISLDVQNEDIPFASGYRMIEILHDMVSPILTPDDLTFFNNMKTRWEIIKDQIDREEAVIAAKAEGENLEMELAGEQAW